MRDRIIGALETACRLGEMLKIQNRHVLWDTHQISIPAAHAKDAEARRIPFEPNGRLAQILKRRRFLGPKASVFGGATGEYQGTIRTAWESLVLLAHGIEPTRTRAHGRVNREKLSEIDLHWHDLRHEAACRWLAKGLDLRAIQLILGHADLKTTQRYLNVTGRSSARRCRRSCGNASSSTPNAYLLSESFGVIATRPRLRPRRRTIARPQPQTVIGPRSRMRSRCRCLSWG
jgi:integrase